MVEVFHRSSLSNPLDPRWAVTVEPWLFAVSKGWNTTQIIFWDYFISHYQDPVMNQWATMECQKSFEGRLTGIWDLWDLDGSFGFPWQHGPQVPVPGVSTMTFKVWGHESHHGSISSNHLLCGIQWWCHHDEPEREVGKGKGSWMRGDVSLRIWSSQKLKLYTIDCQRCVCKSCAFHHRFSSTRTHGIELELLLYVEYVWTDYCIGRSSDQRKTVELYKVWEILPKMA